jgi:hypothetical protein
MALMADVERPAADTICIRAVRGGDYDITLSGRSVEILVISCKLLMIRWFFTWSFSPYNLLDCDWAMMQMEQDDRAPFLAIGHQAFQSIEYPGPIGPSTSSLEKALRTLGHQEDLDAVFNKSRSQLDLNFRPGDHWAHPVAGDRATTHRLLLKVTRRRRRRTQDDGDGSACVDQSTNHSQVGGLYKVDIPGTVKQTVRFRG